MRSKDKFKFWREIWQSYKRSRTGILGLYILVFFIIMAASAPLISPYDPINDKFLAESHAYPSWFSILAPYKDMPKTKTIVIHPQIDEDGWSVISQENVQIFPGDNLVIKYESPTISSGKLILTRVIEYQNSPPKSFTLEGGILAPRISNTLCRVKINLSSPSDESYLLWNKTLRAEGGFLNINFDSKGVSFEVKHEMGLEWYDNVAEVMFSRKGLYRLELVMEFEALDDVALAEVSIGEFTFQIPGLLHGFLGADHIGADLFSQLIYGSRISLLIGVTSSLISIFIGLIAGLIAGYCGGYVDEGTMRVVDLLLVIPFLPLLMVISGLFGRNIWNLIFLLGVLSWPGFARIVRAQVLQLKTSTFVEASKALGGSSFHIIRSHLIPNVLPYAYAALALAIPGFIITEAALSFLALGDPRTPSWGRMFYTANAFGAFRALAWWWIIPPGIMITLLSLAFVFIGYSLDEVLNPRLRARR